MTSSGQSLEQRPLSTEEDTDARELDMLLSMSSMSKTITYSDVEQVSSVMVLSLCPTVSTCIKHEVGQTRTEK